MYISNKNYSYFYAYFKFLQSSCLQQQNNSFLVIYSIITEILF